MTEIFGPLEVAVSARAMETKEKKERKIGPYLENR